MATNTATPPRPSGQINANPSPRADNPAATADAVAASVGENRPVEAQPAAPARPIPTNPVQLAPIHVQRESVLIDYYVEDSGVEDVPYTVQDHLGGYYTALKEQTYTQLYVRSEYAWIDDNGTATLVDGSISNIPFGPGIPGHYGRPGLGTTQLGSRTIARN
jgi:hypothetical protein